MYSNSLIADGSRQAEADATTIRFISGYMPRREAEMPLGDGTGKLMVVQTVQEGAQPTWGGTIWVEFVEVIVFEHRMKNLSTLWANAQEMAAAWDGEVGQALPADWAALVRKQP